jgi:hypothetical protein
MGREELRDLGYQRRLEGRVGGMAIVELAPHGHGAIDAEGGQDQRLAVGPFLLAGALGDLEGEGLRLGKLIRAPDTAGGGVKGPIAAL